MNERTSINLVSLIGKIVCMNWKQKGSYFSVNKMYFGFVLMLHSSVSETT